MNILTDDDDGLSLFPSFLTATVEDSLALIRKSLRSVHMSQAEAFEEMTPHLFVIFGASVTFLKRK